MTRSRGFTLIELLTVVVVMIILFSIVAFSAGGARSSARDDRRKADLAAISSGLERYRSDCGAYPTTSVFDAVANGASLNGSGATPACVTSNIYIRQKPSDPDSARRYSYVPNASQTAYILCAALESAPVPTMPPSDLSACGSCGSSSCNYLIRNP